MRIISNKYFLIITLAILLVLVIFLGYKFLGSSGQDATATLNVTQAYQTVNAKLTQAVAQTPELTTQPTATATQVLQQTATRISATVSPTATEGPSTPVGDCTNRAAPGVPIDVTIPDNTQMDPGQEFTKTWRLQNAGTCTWTTEYSVAYFSGESMGAPASVKLSQSVPPGQSVDISVDMVAPQQAGSYQSNWKLRTGTGEWFGIGPNWDSPFWVLIRVSTLPTESPTPTLGMPTITPTPAVLVSGSAQMVPGDKLDLDTGAVNSGGGDDLTYVSVAEGIHQLQTIGSARLGVFGASEPSFEDCRSASPSATFVNVEALSPGTYLCYLTSLGWPGRGMISSFNTSDATLVLDIVTWSIP